MIYKNQSLNTYDKEEKEEKKKKIKQYFNKIGKHKVTFGRYKNQQLSYSSLLKHDESYCRYVSKFNYNVPAKFKAYCAYKFIQYD